MSWLAPVMLGGVGMRVTPARDTLRATARALVPARAILPHFRPKLQLDGHPLRHRLTRVASMLGPGQCSLCAQSQLG